MNDHMTRRRGREKRTPEEKAADGRAALLQRVAGELLQPECEARVQRAVNDLRGMSLTAEEVGRLEGAAARGINRLYALSAAGREELARLVGRALRRG